MAKKRPKKGRGGRRPSRRLPPALAIGLTLRERLGQTEPRGIRPVAFQGFDKILGRVPLLGLRSQKDRAKIKKYQERYRQQMRDLKYPLREIAGTRTICQQRAERREALFKTGVAGTGRRRSPGRDRTYMRTEESQVHCRKVRR